MKEDDYSLDQAYIICIRFTYYIVRVETIADYQFQ